ncbi:hypothetical protein [Prescottella equi]|uniref:hypothetical protein n=1 Tax=Rhodococcus hoagii TaxID=43767 RepID=UPI000D1007CA|nr:hypothetical protein [Prescottella equi]AVP71289.1 hypothetical protein C7H75_24720 [Prescottella equi]
MSIADTLAAAAAEPAARKRCAVGKWLDKQTPADRDGILDWVAEGRSRNQLHRLLRDKHRFPFGVSALNNHLAPRCGCEYPEPADG